MYQRSRKNQVGRIEAAVDAASNQVQDVEARKQSEAELQAMIDRANRVADRAMELVQAGESFVVCPRRPGEGYNVIKFRDGRREVVE
ncbi:MAG: hypothetical protein KIT63_23845 [Rhodoferax sp.]|nr:hypothetical protein [Rhodoferax sp.]